MKDKRNLSLVMDFYELTMSQCYFNDNKDKEVVFDLFYRKNPDDGGYCVFAGLEQVVDYVSNLHFEKEDIDYLRSLNQFSEDFLEYLSTIRFTGDIYAIPEGTPVFPHEPLVRVKAPIIEAQLVETALLLAINHQTLIATKSRRIVQASEGRAVMEFGARRAHNFDAAILGARAAYIAGCAGSATTYSGKEFGVPVLGTMAHSFIQSFDTEYDAFMYYAKTYPNACTLLIDTYSTLKSGIVNAIKVAKDYLEPNGYRLKGVRIDSGDMAYLSKKVRKMLDEAGMKDCKIVVSNSLDEYVIESLIHQQGAKIDSFGVGENLIVGSLTSEKIYSYDWILKFVLTILTLSAGFQGGEVTPLFAIGSSLGVIIAPVFGLNPLFVAALGYCSVFGAATNTFLAPIAIGMEVFGYQYFPFFFVVCAIAYIVNQNESIYALQRQVRE